MINCNNAVRLSNGVPTSEVVMVMILHGMQILISSWPSYRTRNGARLDLHIPQDTFDHGRYRHVVESCVDMFMYKCEILVWTLKVLSGSSMQTPRL